MADRIVGFLQVLYDAARSQGRETLIDITSDIFGYKAPEASMGRRLDQPEAGPACDGP